MARKRRASKSVGSNPTSGPGVAYSTGGASFVATSVGRRAVKDRVRDVLVQAISDPSTPSWEVEEAARLMAHIYPAPFSVPSVWTASTN